MEKMNNEEFIAKLKGCVVIYLGADGKTYVDFDIPLTQHFVKLVEEFKG